MNKSKAFALNEPVLLLPAEYPDLTRMTPGEGSVPLPNPLAE